MPTLFDNLVRLTGKPSRFGPVPPSSGGGRDRGRWGDALAGASCSGEEAFHEAAVDVREAEAPPLEAEGQALVVDAEEVEEGRLEVVDVDRVLGHVHGEVIRGAVGDARLDAAAGHPEG